MTKNTQGREKNSHRRKTNQDYESGAEKLLHYADAHPSARELVQLKIKAELRRWAIEQHPPTVEDIQRRYNFTVEHAEKFLKKLHKARNPVTKKPTVKDVKPGPVERSNTRPTLLAAEPVVQKNAEESGGGAVSVQLSAVLADIRRRYGDEIRQRGEQTSAKEGFVYLVTNPSFQGWVKAGMTIDYELRIGTYNTSDPLCQFGYARLAWTPNRRQAEQQLLVMLQHTAEETRGEWFRLQLQEATSNFDKSQADAGVRLNAM